MIQNNLRYQELKKLSNEKEEKNKLNFEKDKIQI